MNRAIGLVCAGFAALVVTIVAQPAGRQPLALRGGRVVTVTHGVQDRATVLVVDGRIAAVGREVAVPAGAVVIDVSGEWVFPGLIDAFSNLGAGEIESYGRDDDEATGPVTPHLRVVDALNPANRFIDLARRSGITAALTVPGEGNVLCGQSAVIRLTDGIVDEMVLRSPAGQHASLGEAPKLRYGKKEQPPSTRMGQVALLRQTLLDAQDYRDKRAREPRKTATDLKLEALIPVLDRTCPLVVSADRRDDIITAMKVADEFRVKLIVSHGTEAYKVAGRLAEAGVPVILGPLAADSRRVETGNPRVESAAVLVAAGVKVAFQGGLGGPADGVLLQARRAVANGLPHDEAVKSLTLSAAEILGVEDSIGSLEPGKRADIVVFSADPLQEAATVRMVIVGGKRMPLE